MKKANEDNANKCEGTPIGFRRAFGIAIPLCLAALILAGAIISVANDVYAFVKPEREIALNVSEPLDARSFSRLLQSSGVINNAFLFEYYLGSHGLDDDVSLLSGDIRLNSRMSYRELVAEIF